MTPVAERAGTVAVLGWGRSGRAAARLARRLGWTVRVSESRAADALSDEERAALAEAGADLETGGHTAAFLGGADLVVVSPGADQTRIEAVRTAGVPVVGELEFAARALRAPAVAVTGTDGKSTTTELTGHLLRAVFAGTGREVHVCGNIGRPVSEIASAASEADVAIVEVSSFQMETIETFRPSVAVLLNVAPDHLDRYPSIREYRAAKARVFMNQTEADAAVVNLDDEGAASLWAEARGRARLVGLSASRRVPGGLYVREGSVVDETAGTPRVLADLAALPLDPFKAPENLLGALAAAALVTGEAPGLRDRLAPALRSFRGLPHRLERVGAAGGVTFWNDSKATTVHATAAALRRLDRPVVLLMGGRDKGEDFSSLGPLVREKVVCLIGYGEARGRLLDALGGYVPSRSAEAFDEAVHAAYDAATDTGALLLSPSCSSYDQFRDYAERGDRFKAIARSLGAR